MYKDLCGVFAIIALGEQTCGSGSIDIGVVYLALIQNGSFAAACGIKGQVIAQMLCIEGGGSHRTGQMQHGAHQKDLVSVHFLQGFQSADGVAVTETAGFSCTDTLAAVPEQPVTTNAAASTNASIRSCRARLCPIVYLLDLRV